MTALVALTSDTNYAVTETVGFSMRGGRNPRDRQNIIPSPLDVRLDRPLKKDDLSRLAPSLVAVFDKRSPDAQYCGTQGN